ncbi:MAG TPA: NAD(P)/FAD-dependent oxidoreductase [Gemmatimonadales bacterium]|nr:NAD(P)/FAD-dependent oxidoreductase [Gemmatimonadales bacterium]
MPEGAPIHVSGAGPSGLAAAIVASRAGRRVIVHERAADVGHRFHDDFQGLENWTTGGDVIDELASLGIDPAFDHTPIREAVVFDPRNHVHTYRSPRPLFYLVRRGAGGGTLDSSLKSQALTQGIEIGFGEPRRHFPEGGVVAEGPHGSDAIAVGYVFATTAADGAYAAISDRLAPKGYSYLLLIQGRGIIASCMFDHFHNESLYLERTVAFFRENVGFVMTGPQRFGGTGNFAVPNTARRGNLLFVGEAAGFQDALWGFGMRYAMVSGSLAARSLVSGRPEDYDRMWGERLGGLLRTGTVNRFIYEKLGERGYIVLARWLDRAADPRASLRWLYRPSLLTKLLYPIARRAVRSSRRETQCPLEGCDCTWCRCRHVRAQLSEAPSGGRARHQGEFVAEERSARG